MNFLIDAQLPPSIGVWLRSRGHNADHLTELDLLEASDSRIWSEALERGAILITKDRDFADWAITREPAPQIVWVRTGNLRSRVQFERISKAWLGVLAQLTEGAPVVELR